VTLEQLKYLCAIVETGSFRAAAETVFRSQSSLSISIQKLEKELGITLFTRDSYRPELTGAGQAIYQKAKRLRTQEKELIALAEHLASDCEAELCVSISGIVPIEPVIKVFEEIKSIYPAIRLTLLTENLAGTMERLHDDAADIAITEVFDMEAGFDSESLTAVNFITVVPGSSVWAKDADTLTEQDIENETIIVVRDTSIHSQRMSKGLVEHAPQWIVNDFAAKQRILCSGSGWGRMPMHLVDENLKQGQLVALNQQSFKLINVPVKIVRKQKRPRGLVAQQLWQALQEADWLCE